MDYEIEDEPPKIPKGHASTLNQIPIEAMITDNKKISRRYQILSGVLIICILILLYRMSVNLVGTWISDDGAKHKIHVHEWLGYKTIYSVGVSTFETVLGSQMIKFKEDKDSPIETISYKADIITLGDGSNWRKTVDWTYMMNIEGVWDGTHLDTHYRLSVSKGEHSNFTGSMTEGSVTAHISGKFSGWQGSFTDDLGKIWKLDGGQDNVTLTLSDKNKNIEVVLHKLN